MEHILHKFLLHSCNSSDLSLYCGKVDSEMKYYTSIEILFLMFCYLFIESKITSKTIRNHIHDLRYFIEIFSVSYNNDNKIFYA